MTDIFEYKGHYLLDVVQHREPGVLPERLNIEIGNINLSKEDRHLSIAYNIDIVNAASTIAHYSYISLFFVNDQEFINSFLNTAGNHSKKYDGDTANILITMIRYSFPYIRESIHSMTSDLSGAVLLPLIDAKALLNTRLEFISSSLKTSAAKE